MAYDDRETGLTVEDRGSKLGLPQNQDAEANVLAAMLLSPEVVEEAQVELQPDDFYRPIHKTIYTAMVDMYNSRIPIDSISLIDYLRSINKLDAVGGEAYILELMGQTLSLVNWQHHAAIVRRDSMLRELIGATNEINALAYNAPTDTKEVVELAESKLLKVTAREVKSSYKTLTEFMVEAYNEAEEVCQAGGQAAGVPTGFPSLDRMLMGFREGQLIIIGARPAVGKTSFALNLALNAAAAGYTVGFFSLEMSGKEIAQRLICAYAMISISDFRMGRISPEQWANINEATQTLSLVNWQHHAAIVRRDSMLRELIGATNEINALAYNAPTDTKEVVELAESKLLKVTAREVKSSYKTLTEFMVEAYNEAEEVCQAGGQAAGVPTGFPSLDRMLMGFREGQLIIIGARPAVGKTSFALNLALNAAAAGYTVGFFSLEMSGKEIAQRLICAYAMISISDFRMGRISPEQWANINEATQTLSKLDILIDDTPGTTVTEIRAKSRRMLHNKEKAIIILDYLQLVSPPPGRRSESRTVEVSEMSRGMKIMAKELKIPLIALSQLSRQVESRTGKRPQLSDLRESGSIEQDADIVMFLDRSADEAEASRDDRPDEGVTRIVVAKNRSGPIGDVDLMFLPASTKFYELDGAHTEE